MIVYIKKRIVKNLIDEIKCLDATDIELVGHNVISSIEGQSLVHHGINKDYKPVGHTVDSFSDDSSVIGEYSTEKDYFDDAPSFAKITKDIEHAIKHNEISNPNKIYLVSTEEEIPSFRKKFNKTDLFNKVKDVVVFLDARRLAEEVYEQSINNDLFANSYKEFFPRFAQDLNNFEYYGKAPSLCDGYVSSTSRIEAIASHFANGNSVCVLCGLSGSGKTQTAIDYLRKKLPDFGNYLWISGNDWTENTPLSSIQRSRGGAAVNVSGLFNASKTILVIDSIERVLSESHFEELKEGFEKGGVVLATSQLTTARSQIYLENPVLQKDVAIQILGETQEGISGLGLDFVEACLFMPLMLSTARNIIKIQGVDKEDLYREILDSPEDVGGEDGKSIMRRILDRLSDKEKDALTKIANSNSTVNDLKFMRFWLGTTVCVNLQRLSILNSTTSQDVVMVHDLICASMRTAEDKVALVDKMNGFIGKFEGEMQSSVLRQIHLCYQHILECYPKLQGEQYSWLSYALLQVEGDCKLEIYKKFYDIPIDANLSLAKVMCIIDAQETHAYTISNHEEREKYYSYCANIYNSASQIVTNEEIKIEFLYHRAKALRRCGEYSEALKCFVELLVERPNWNAVHGQITHLGSHPHASHVIKEEGERSIKILFDAMLEKEDSVPLRVSLAAIAKLRSYRNPRDEIKKNKDAVERLADIIAASALDGLGQFYEAFVSFSSMFGYHYSSLCVGLAEALPQLEILLPKSVEKRQWVSACEAFANTSVAAVQENKCELSIKLMDASVRFADAIWDDFKLSPYDIRALTKVYVSAKQPKKALEVVAVIPDEEQDHWILYRKTEALLCIEDYDEALINALRAFDLFSKDKKAQYRKAAYHDLLSRCHEKKGDYLNAINEAENAVSACSDDKYSRDLTRKILNLKSFL